MSWEKFGRDRYRPEGRWDLFYPATLKVAGVHHRKGDAGAFADAVKAAEQARLRYGVRIVAEPTNPFDGNALAVYGWAEVRGWLKSSRREWKVGFVPASLAADVAEQRAAGKRLQLDAELYSVYRSDDDFIDIQFFLLCAEP